MQIYHMLLEYKRELPVEFLAYKLGHGMDETEETLSRLAEQGVLEISDLRLVRLLPEKRKNK